MEEFICTFGSGQLGGFGLHYYVEVIAPNEILGRLILNKAFDGKWSSIYKKEWFLKNYLEKYGPIRMLGRLNYSHHSNEIDEIYYQNELV